MTAHSPEPLTIGYDGESLPILFRGVQIVALIRTNDEDARLLASAPALSQENARLREALAGCLEALELIGYMRDNGEYQTSGQILIHGDQREDCGRAVLTARTALRAGGAEKGVWT